MNSRNGRICCLLAFILAAAACAQDDSLVQGATTPAGTGWQSPPPGTPAKIPYVGPSDCYGNADGEQFVPTDADDPPGESDAWRCLWLCADEGKVDPITGVPYDPNPPHEIIEVWDFDGGAPSYMESFQIVGACNSNPNP